VLLSTDMFTLIDEDAIVPIDNFVKTADDKAWLGSFYKAFMLNSQIGGKTWGVPVPALDHGAVLQQGTVQGSRPGPEQAAGQLGRAARAWRRSSP
jgi:shikimate kinase